MQSIQNASCFITLILFIQELGYKEKERKKGFRIGNSELCQIKFGIFAGSSTFLSDDHKAFAFLESRDVFLR